MDIPVLEDLGDVSGKRVFVRLDLNVPLSYDAHGNATIVDDFRIRASLPTLEYLVNAGAIVTVGSHLGRPNGVADSKYSLEPIAKYLSKVLPSVKLLENLRFNPGEEANDPALVQELIKDQDLYVNDAFGAAHRAHASIVGPPAYLPSAAGRLLAREVQVLSNLLSDPVAPFVAIIGGAKVSDKLALLEAMIPKVDTLLIGGAMAFTFLAAKGHSVGDSMFEKDKIASCSAILNSGAHLVLPSDFVALSSDGKFGRNAGTGTVKEFTADIPSGYRGLDIGDASIEEFSSIIAGAGTILWNGPMGVFEDARFNKGTFAIANAVASADAFTVVGGGDSAAAIEEAGLSQNISHLSTGGGASLELLEKGDLPGLKALRDAPTQVAG